MKKAILAILILILCAAPLLFTACSNVSQRDLLTTGYSCSKTENAYELYRYDVYQADEEGRYTILVGEMTMKFEPLDYKTADLYLPSASKEEGEKISKGYKGTLLSVDVKMTNSDAILSRVVYDSACLPYYSYKRTVIGGEKKEMQVTYGEKYLYADLYVNGTKASSVEHKKSNCYDNESLYAIVRASKVSESSYSLSFTCVNALTGNADGITISKAGTAEDTISLVTTDGVTERTVPTYIFTVSTDNQYASSYAIEIAQEDQPVKSGESTVNAKKVIISIVEGAYKYSLKQIEIN